ncbi:MAG: DUF6435 family protein [Gammaproteobacteria bacterium]|nr:DUF6435 family protein [Gammaproteobacteria bacterium]
MTEAGAEFMPFFKRDPAKKLKRAYQQKLESAMHAMRRGDVRGNAQLMEEAEKIRIELERST